MSRVPVITWNQLSEVEDTISELPVDLSDEKSSITKFPFWEKHLLVRHEFIHATSTVRSFQGLMRKQWLGFDVNHYFGRVDVNLVSLGRPQSYTLGCLNYIEIFRDNGDTLVAAKIPSRIPSRIGGDVSKFICRASSEEYAAIVRMAVRIDID